MRSLRMCVCLFITYSIIINPCYAVSICSWNLKDFGNAKSVEELEFIASTIKDYDIVQIQEVVAGDGGAQAVAKLVYMLNTKGTGWDYVISDPTSSDAYQAERYAFFWKTAKITRVGDPWLEKKFCMEIGREPFFYDIQGRR